ncbi:MAG: hypothetical protein KJ970_09790 [Candidatus Eisenbacteria bacterium]|uniref:Uncharacterized protein n=1 Tax=Eiseniibacteriota bacterium TaxID=2212470 RepID=A0A948W673_UNCEI|nr:hypothetical protein [Candidatus Eisenbacteria bacterium]
MILLGAGGFLISCDEGPPVPISPETTWTSLRYHEYGVEGSVDLVLDHNGNIDVTDLRDGKTIAQDGYLSKGSVVEIDKLVAAVEPVPSRAEVPCSEGPRFFVSIIQDDMVLSFGGSPCQPVPENQAALAETLGRIAGYQSTFRPIVYHSIDQGRGHLKPGHYILRSQDDVSRTLQELSPSQPVIWPSIRFTEEMILGVVGEWDLLAIQVRDLSLTEDGQVKMTVLETIPYESCHIDDGYPFHFVRLPVNHGDLFIERETEKVPCGDF